MANLHAESPPTPPAAAREQLLALLRRDQDQPLWSLAPDQRRVWLLQMLDPGVPLHVFGAVEIDGRLDLGQLQRGAEEVVRRHASLRSAFVKLARGPIRVCAPSAAVPIRVIASESDQHYHQQIEEAANEDARRPFDLRTAPLLRLSVVSRGPERHAMLVTLHQIVADVYSPALFIEECLRVAHEPGPDCEPASDDVARAWGTGTVAPVSEDADASGRRLQFWRTYLDGLPVLELPLDEARPPVRTHNGAAMSCELDAEPVARLRDLCDARGTTMPAVALAAFQMLLSWYTGQDDIAIGMPVDTRSDGAIGPLAHTAVVRTRLVGDPDVLDVVDRVSDEVRKALAHALPLAQLIDELNPARDLSRTPLFQAFFVSSDTTAAKQRIGPLVVTPLEVRVDLAMFDLALAVRTEERRRMRLTLEYNRDLLYATTIQRMLSDLRRVLMCVTTPPRRLSQLLAGDDGAGGAACAPPRPSEVHGPVTGSCLHELVLAQAQRMPDAVAACAGAVHLTYGTIRREVDRVAAFLRRQGIGPERTVGVCSDDQLQALVAILAVLQSGGACVPLDPHLPAERLAFMIHDARITVVLTGGSVSVRELEPCAVPLDRALANGTERGDEWPLPSLENLAYVIYTSGSTGRPKGVAVPHRSIVNNLAWRQRTWPLDERDRVLQNYSFSFDPSMWATWWPLLAGACVVLPDAAGHFDSRALARLMADERITVYGAAPSLHSVLLEESALEECTSLRDVFSGGEALDGPLRARFQERLGASLWNMYGPTEATIDCSYWPCPHVENPAPAPIGHAIANTTLYTVNRHLAITPPGVPGEIHVGGLALARGYVGDPALTAEKFLPDPFAGDGGRMYRTGDLGRYRPPHGFEFIGRVDHQVKVRGFRIELGEIERALLATEGVREAVVVLRQQSEADARIAAYVVPRPAADCVTAGELAASLAARLPEYMVPDVFVTLDALPRTSTGKVDRQALPAPAEPAASSPGVFRAPRDTLETEIARIVGGVLGLESIAIDADLFDLGCNSLLIARVASRLSHAYHIELPVQRMFRDPTVAGIAALVQSFQRGAGQELTVPWTESQLEAEAELPPEITAERLPRCDPERVRRVLITGVTGYVGAFLLERLLQDTAIECECLVRADDSVHALERVREVMERYRIWNPAYVPRIRLVPGDVAKESLGLSREEFGRLAREIDAIYHCAALVNFVYPYSALRPTNVIGTREVLRLASTVTAKGVHYISTVDVLLGTHMQRPFIETDEVLRKPPEVPDGYARSKWIAEKMLAHARDRGIPTTVYRPGLIMGHTVTGATQTNDYLLIGLKGYLDLGVLPEPEILIDFVTVDFVAKAIACLSLKRESAGKYYHIWNPRTVHMAQAYEWIRSFGYALDIVPGRVLRDKVLKEVDVSNALYPFVPIFRAMRDDPPISPHHPSILGKVNILEECANTYQALAASGIECSPLSEDLAHRCFSYLVSIGFLPEPAAHPAAHA